MLRGRGSGKRGIVNAFKFGGKEGVREIAWEMLSTLESARDRENAVVFVERDGEIVIRSVRQSSMVRGERSEQLLTFKSFFSLLIILNDYPRTLPIHFLYLIHPVPQCLLT